MQARRVDIRLHLVQYIKKQVVSDPHSPRQFRVIGPARNIDVWYDDFKVQPSDKMFVAPEERVRIW